MKRKAIFFGLLVIHAYRRTCKDRKRGIEGIEKEREREREWGSEASDGFDGTRGRSPFFVTSSRLVHAGKSDFCQLESYRSSWILYKITLPREESSSRVERFFRFIFSRGGGEGALLRSLFSSFSFFFFEEIRRGVSMEFFESC